MRLSIDHKTGFRYASAVASSYNEARMIPASTATQTVWSSRVSIDPAADYDATLASIQTSGQRLPRPFPRAPHLFR